ncbi:hypothetical protein [Agrobacterium tumefaciens]|uniref:hypothetical protein n=1 Tax=Agrobacterium tumefaciens TaxID=358 RepID=UPI002201D64D|nr:hypothetical protein FY143_27145 [Agrobacterium tumefaciens]
MAVGDRPAIAQINAASALWRSRRSSVRFWSGGAVCGLYMTSSPASASGISPFAVLSFGFVAV